CVDPSDSSRHLFKPPRYPKPLFTPQKKFEFRSILHPVKAIDIILSFWLFGSDYHYEGPYRAQASGSQDYRSLRFYPKSIILSKSGRYAVIEYQDNYNRRKSFVLKEDMPDLRKYRTSNLKLGSEYRNEPYKAITKIVIMRN